MPNRQRVPVIPKWTLSRGEKAADSQRKLTFPVSTDKSSLSLVPICSSLPLSLSPSLPLSLSPSHLHQVLIFDMQAVGEKQHRVHVGLCNLKSTDSEGWELETCYEKMRRWANSRMPIRLLRPQRMDVHGHAPVSPSLPSVMHVTPAAENWGKLQLRLQEQYRHQVSLQ